MEYCKKCVQPNTRPGVRFIDGVCGACLYEEQKDSIDWGKRQIELIRIVNSVKVTNRGIYDCVLGVSGGKDSTYCSLYARDKLGLRCLLVNSEPEGITEIGRHNIANLKNLGFDVISIRPNPQVMQKLVKRDFFTYLNPVKVTEYSLWASAYIIADKFDIPLMIQGENPSLTLGTDIPQDNDALNADKQNTLADGWEQYKDIVDEKDLYLFHYDHEKLKNKTKAIWLNYYDKDWSPKRNAKFSKEHGIKWRTHFEPDDIGTYVPYAQLDQDLTQVNQMFKYYKFGFGQCTDYCCYDIRRGELKREEAWELLEKYDGKCASRYIKKFYEYIHIGRETFWNTVDKFVNKELFEKVDGKWQKKFSYPSK